MNICLLASHGIAEYDDVRMFHDLGFGIFAPGGYENPATPGESLRPALPDVPYLQDLAQRCWEQRALHAQEDPQYAVDWAKHDLHPDVIDWADVIIVHHFPDRWIAHNWPRIQGKRVIWRTCGQSNPQLEAYMAQFPGLEVVRYSPAERRYFEKVGAFAGEDALIRFGKYPADYGPWRGDGAFQIDRPATDDQPGYFYARTGPYVANVTQRMRERGDSTGLGFYLAATEGLPARPAGPGSEQLPGGIGALSYDDMREYLRAARAYIYTGTTPASYTLGLIEAMLSGVPVVSIGPSAWYGPAELFEGHELAEVWSNDTGKARESLSWLLNHSEDAAFDSQKVRERAEALFSVDVVGPQWKALLS